MEATGRRLRPPASLPGPLQHLLPCSSCASWQRARTGSLPKDKHTALRSTSSSRRARGPCSLAWPAATEVLTPQPEMLTPSPAPLWGLAGPQGQRLGLVGEPSGLVKAPAVARGASAALWALSCPSPVLCGPPPTRSSLALGPHAGAPVSRVGGVGGGCTGQGW